MERAPDVMNITFRNGKLLLNFKYPQPHKWAARKGEYTPGRGVDWSSVVCPECGEVAKIGVWKCKPCKRKFTGTITIFNLKRLVA